MVKLLIKSGPKMSHKETIKEAIMRKLKIDMDNN